MRRVTFPVLTVSLCLGLVATTPAQTGLSAEVFVSGLNSPVGFVQDPTQSNVQFVIEQHARIRVIRDGVLLPTDFLDLRGQIVSGGEQGTLGLAFPPDAATTRRAFVNFTDANGDTVVARYQRFANDPLRLDPSTRFDLGWPGCTRYIDQPAGNHNGGSLAFGDDGYLYIGMGDGGGGGDPLNHAQRSDSVLGKMLRLDVSVPDSDGRGYAVPADNPMPFGAGFVIGALCNTAVPYQQTAPGDLMWDIGLRNPWRYAFDLRSHGGSGALIIGDVGQGSWEEINYEPFGRGNRNYGWRNREGAHPYDGSLSPANVPIVDPIFEYSHSTGQAIMGGEVYRGTALGYPYFGRYFFADFNHARVWSLRLTVSPSTGEATPDDLFEHTSELGGSSVLGNISAFGIDARCQLYIVSYSRGQILRVVRSGGTSAGDCATPDPFVSMGGGVFIDPGWVPADHPAGAGLTLTLNTSSSSSGGSSSSSGSTSSGGSTIPCPGSAPVTGWLCINGGWIPPDHPLAQGGGSSSGSSGGSSSGGSTSSGGTASCPGSDPFAGIPGMSGVCVNGSWIPSNNPLSGTP